MENINKKSLLSFMLGFKKIIGVIGAVVFLVGAAWLNDVFKDPTFMCFKGHDKCIMDAVYKARDARDTGKAQLIAQLKIFEEDSNKGIESLKSGLSIPFVNDELKAGRKENVPTSLLKQLSQLIAPQAEAKDNGLNDVSFSEPAYSPMRPENGLNEFLRSKGSPFAYVDLPSIAERNGLTPDELYLLVAISGQESSFGTVFKRKDGPGLRIDNENGVKTYNPVGIKWCLHVDGCPPNNSIPDESGFYLQHYRNWEQFWDTYTRQMKLVYFDGQCDSTDCMKNKYVGGTKEHKKEWKDAIDGFIGEIKAFGRKYYDQKVNEHNS